MTIDTTDAGLAIVVFGIVRQIRQYAPKVDGLYVVLLVIGLSVGICVALDPHAVVNGLIKALKVAAIALGTGEVTSYGATKVASETMRLSAKPRV